MSAKDKAKDIYDSYWYCLLQSDIHNRHYWSKQCALITVDEILKQCWDYRDIDLQASYDYWQEVKQEIEEL
jgi:hypothetical protein